MNKISRRGFVRFFLFGSFYAWLVVFFQSVIRYLTPPKGDKVPDPAEVRISKTVSEIENNSGFVFAFGEKPALLVRGPAGKISAFFAACSHLGCTVGYDSVRGVILCACHNGIFDRDGKNISGPPPKPLTALQVVVSGDRIIVKKPLDA